MGSPDAGRVIVGIDRTLSGFEALRHAVRAAIDRGQPLIAVRAFRIAAAGPGATLRAVFASAARDEITAAFDEALGGVPHDLRLQVLAREGRAGDVLTATADRPGDLLVIGGAQRHRMVWPSGGGIARHCAIHAVCPVVIVPPPRLARHGSARRMAGLAVREAERWCAAPASHPIGRTYGPEEDS